MNTKSETLSDEVNFVIKEHFITSLGANEQLRKEGGGTGNSQCVKKE